MISAAYRAQLSRMPTVDFCVRHRSTQVRSLLKLTVHTHIYRSTCRQHTPTPTDPSAGEFAAIISSACPAVSIAADVVFLDSRETVAALAFSTKGGCIAASAGTADRPSVNPFRTPVPFWGHTTQIPSNLSPIVPKTRLRS